MHACSVVSGRVERWKVCPEALLLQHSFSEERGGEAEGSGGSSLPL